jgi:hypothetical protein
MFTMLREVLMELVVQVVFALAVGLALCLLDGCGSGADPWTALTTGVWRVTCPPDLPVYLRVDRLTGATSVLDGGCAVEAVDVQAWLP